MDFADRQVPVKRLNLSATTLWRIHRTVHSPLFFTRRSKNPDVYRFDAPADEYGVLYASESFDACMAETVIRDSFTAAPLPLMLDEATLAERSISALGHADPRELLLADFTQPLIALGFTTQVLSDPDYTAPNVWSKAVHDHPDRFDGIYFTSRYANAPSVAIFDSVHLIERGAPIPLADHPATDEFLDRYQIALIPSA